MSSITIKGIGASVGQGPSIYSNPGLASNGLPGEMRLDPNLVLGGMGGLGDVSNGLPAGPVKSWDTQQKQRFSVAELLDLAQADLVNTYVKSNLRGDRPMPPMRDSLGRFMPWSSDPRDRPLQNPRGPKGRFMSWNSYFSQPAGTQTVSGPTLIQASDWIRGEYPQPFSPGALGI